MYLHDATLRHVFSLLFHIDFRELRYALIRYDADYAEDERYAPFCCAAVRLRIPLAIAHEIEAPSLFMLFMLF